MRRKESQPMSSENDFQQINAFDALYGPANQSSPNMQSFLAHCTFEIQFDQRPIARPSSHWEKYFVRNTLGVPPGGVNAAVNTQSGLSVGPITFLMAFCTQMSSCGCVIAKLNESWTVACHDPLPFGRANVFVLGLKLQPEKPTHSFFNSVSMASLSELLFVQTLILVVLIRATAEQVA